MNLFTNLYNSISNLYKCILYIINIDIQYYIYLKFKIKPHTHKHVHKAHYCV